MMSATLYREGDDLEVLLAELDEKYPGQVRVVSMTHTRQGGMLGFFARQRVGVHYALDANATGSAELPATTAQRSITAAPDDDRSPLDELIDAAEEYEQGEQRGTHPPRRTRTAPARVASTSEVEPANVEFAQMLMELAAQKAASRVSEQVAEAPAPAPAPVAAAMAMAQLLSTQGQTQRATQPAFEPIVAAAPVAPAPAPVKPAPAAAAVVPAPAAMPQPIFTSPVGPAPEVRTSLTLRRQLAELGVPIEWVSDDVTDAYRAVEQLVAMVPEAPEPPVGLGEMLVIVGPAAAALRAAEAMRTRMHLRPENVWAAGCADGDVPADRMINDAWQAAGVAATLRLDGRPAVIVVATGDDDDPTSHDDWAAGVVSALAPEQVWALVDATRKPSDTRAALQRVGRTDALIVSGTSRTASPASVWALETPTAMLDGRPATRVAWAVTLLDKLADLTL
jgi:hypothetical protein